MREKRPRGHPTLELVASPARGHEVALRIISTAHSRLDMVERQILRCEHFGAVYAVKAIPLQYPLAAARQCIPGTHEF